MVVGFIGENKCQIFHVKLELLGFFGFLFHGLKDKDSRFVIFLLLVKILFIFYAAFHFLLD